MIDSSFQVKVSRKLITLLDRSPLHWLLTPFSPSDPSFYYSGESQGYGHSFRAVLPWLARRLTRQVGGRLNVLEWGPGLNTYLLRETSRQIVSVESNKVWFRRYGRLFRKDRNVRLKHIPFPDDPGGCKQYPGQLERKNHYVAHPELYDPSCEYVTWPLKAFAPASFHIVFVDGAGYRTDCLQVARQMVTLEGVIVLHDYPRIDGEEPIDMPSGRKYAETVNSFCFKTLLTHYQTSLMSDRCDWFADIVHVPLEKPASRVV
jgi:hypothetical protein